MMKSINTKHRLITAFALIISMLSIPANSQDDSREELDQRAMKSFQEERYENAMPDFKILHDLYPKDARISYYYGRSCLQTNQNLDEAANLLKFSATRNYGEDAYFYLGKVYHLIYQFDDADVAFTTFKKTAKSRYIKSYNIDYWIAVNQNAKKSVTATLKPEVVKNIQVPLNALESAFSENSDGKYIFVPDEFKSETDKLLNYQTLMFLSKEIKIGDYLYIDSKSKAKQGSDIYRIKRIKNEEYSLPEILPVVINSMYDEAFPYFDSQTSILYFSSKGFNTSGGYDIFYSRLDTLNQIWSNPEKLEFPINTPFDDFLYTLSGEDRSVTFLSNRNCAINTINAYTIVNQPVGEYISLWNKEEIISAASMKTGNKNDSNNNMEQLSERKEIMIMPKISDPDEQTAPNDYDKTIREAMELQASSDSLNWIIKELRKQAQNENNYQKKQEIGANISSLDNEAKRIQVQANEKFLLAGQIRNADKSLQPIQQDSQVENIKVYTYIGATTNSQTFSDKDSIKSATYSKGYEAASTAAISELNSGFRIMNSSPYSNDNPIPYQSDLPDGLVYRIQLGAFSGNLENNAFRGLTPLTAEKTTNSNVTKYYVGYFNSVEGARKALDEVKKYGYPDAFLVSYFKGEKIPVQKAREIEFAEK